MSIKDQDYGASKFEGCYFLSTDRERILKLEKDNEALRELVARYADVAATEQSAALGFERGIANYVANVVG